MNIHVVLSLIALTVCAGLLYLSHLCARIAATEADMPARDDAADDDLDALDREIAALPLLIALHGATFTEDEYAKIVALHTKYHAQHSASTTPTTGGDAA